MEIKMITYLHHVCVYDVLLWQEPVDHLLLAHRGRQLEAAQVFMQQLRDLPDVVPLHRPQARGLSALQGVNREDTHLSWLRQQRNHVNVQW